MLLPRNTTSLPERKLSRESPNQRRLPRTVESDEGDDLSFADVERDIEQGLELPVGRAHMGHAEVYWPVSAHRSRLSSLGSTTTRGLLGTLIAVQRLCRQRTAGYRKLLYRHPWLCHPDAARCAKLLYRHKLYREGRSVSTGSFRSEIGLNDLLIIDDVTGGAFGDGVSQVQHHEAIGHSEH